MTSIKLKQLQFTHLQAFLKNYVKYFQKTLPILKMIIKTCDCSDFQHEFFSIHRICNFMNLQLCIIKIERFQYNLTFRLNFFQHKMNEPTQAQQFSIADQLLKQLQDEYLAVHAQNITQPKENVEPQDDPENPYQSLDLDDDDQQQNEDDEFQNTDQFDEQIQGDSQLDKDQFKKQIQNLRIQSGLAEPQVKELIQVPPMDQSIFTSLPGKDFEIDEEKIKSLTLSMEINQPDWLKDEGLCKLRIQELFIKHTKSKPFTKF